MAASHFLLLWSVREEMRRQHARGQSRRTLRLHSHEEMSHKDDASERKVQEGHLTSSVQRLSAKTREGDLSPLPQKVPPDSGTGQNPLILLNTAAIHSTWTGITSRRGCLATWLLGHLPPASQVGKEEAGPHWGGEASGGLDGCHAKFELVINQQLHGQCQSPGAP